MNKVMVAEAARVTCHAAGHGHLFILNLGMMLTEPLPVE